MREGSTRVLRVLGLCALGGLALACNRVETTAAPSPAPAAAQEANGPKPDVLFVTIDTLRADHVGAYGADFARTPTLDSLAAAGVRFETAIAATPITLPSHATLLTGTRPPRHGVRHNGTFKLGEELPTLAEGFAAAGYRTAAVVGAVVLRARYGLARGFEHYDDRIGTRKAGSAGFLERTAREVTDAALARLAAADDAPIFLWVHYYDPHLDHRAPPEFAERFPGRPYDAEIAYVDAELGRLLAGFAERGREPLVSVTSDHGESLGEHGELNHGLTLYDAVTRVPWIVAGPGVPEGSVVAGIARAVDVAPTLLALADLPAPSTAEGVDLSAAFVGGRTEVDWAYAESLLPELDFGWAPLHAIRTPDRLYVRAPRPELYAVREDPGQERDLAGRAESAVEMERLDAHVATVLASEAGEGAPSRIALDPDERARLQALGYALPEAPVAATGLDPKDGLRHQTLVQSGAHALAEGRYAEAETSLRRFLEVAPESARAHGLLASTLLYSGRAKEALPHADRAIEIDPRPAHRYAERAEIRLLTGDEAGAREDFERAEAIDPEDAWVQMGVLWLRLREGAFPAAAEAARRAFALAPNDAFVRLRVGLLWREAGAFRPALESFRDAVRLRPDFELAQMHLALEFARIGQAEAALTHHRKAGAHRYDLSLATPLAMAFAAAGELEASRALLAKLEAKHPDDPRVARARQFLERAEGPNPSKQGEGT